ncbi:MAG: M55 family metallopeptidase [Vampirovibrio sp.]|nr:M55 family metallopeptidase [Vampirovibrio sp.]
MKKLYISADMEGIGGIVSHSECYPQEDSVGYERAVALMNREVSVVAVAALEAGVTELVVNDAHGPMTNLRAELLPKQVKLLSGKPKICAMEAGLDETFDAAFLIGYHARAGALNGVIAHTFHDRIFEVSVNGKVLGESGVNAYYASLVHQVPIIFASGDAAFCEEVTELLPTLETVCTKTGLGYAAALNRDEAGLFTEYRDTVKQVLTQSKTKKPSLLKMRTPYVLQVTFIHPVAADIVMHMPGWTRIDGRAVEYTAQDFQELYQALQSSYAILAYRQQ